MRIFHVVP